MRKSSSWKALLAEGNLTQDGCQLQGGSCAAYGTDLIMPGWHLMCSDSCHMGSTDHFPLHNKGARQPISSTSFTYCTKVFKTLPKNATTIQKCIAVCFPSPNRVIVSFQLEEALRIKYYFPPSQDFCKGTVFSQAWMSQRPTSELEVV